VGGAGDDEIYGGGGDDSIVAGDGNDTVFGGAGNDVIVGANGSVKAVTLGKTSGFRILDTQALIVVQRVSKLFVPVQLRGRDIAVTIPIGFYLQDM